MKLLRTALFIEHLRWLLIHLRVRLLNTEQIFSSLIFIFTFVLNNFHPVEKYFKYFRALVTVIYFLELSSYTCDTMKLHILLLQMFQYLNPWNTILIRLKNVIVRNGVTLCTTVTIIHLNVLI